MSAYDHLSAASLATLTKCGTLAEADAIKGLLESEGIEAFIPDESFSAASGGFHSLAIGYIRVKVRPSNFARARELLERSAPEALSQPVEDAEATERERKRALPLPAYMAVICFLLPTLTLGGLAAQAAICALYRNNGFETKSKRAAFWFCRGMLVWGGLFLAMWTTILLTGR